MYNKTNIVKFDLSESSSYKYLSKLSNIYGKIKGYLLSTEYDLPSSKKGFIIHERISKELVKKLNDEDIYLCRADAPYGYGKYLPRGKDLKLNNINIYINEIKRISKDAIIICLKHPSHILADRYIPRYKTQGAINIAFNVNENIIIEFVGIGFDVGDITRGKEVHDSIIIKWCERFSNPYDIFLFKNIYRYEYFISQGLYSKSRNNRIYELSQKLNESELNDINMTIPLVPQRINYELFSKIYYSCIDSILSRNIKKLGDKFSILINLYDYNLYVFEIWQMMRSD
jgi:hypothetical protein